MLCFFVNREIVGLFFWCWERCFNDVVECGDVVEGVQKFVGFLGWLEVMDVIMNNVKEKWKQYMLMMDVNVNKVFEEFVKSICKILERKILEKFLLNFNG